MHCDDFIPLLVRRIDGALSETDRAALERHLAACAGCRDAAAAQDQVAAALASRPDAEPRPAFAQRVSLRIAEESGWFGVADWRWLSVRLAPVAALLLILAGVFVERQSQPAQRASLSGVVQTWANTSADREGVPVTAVLWEPAANEDSALLTVLTAPPDATIARQADER